MKQRAPILTARGNQGTYAHRRTEQLQEWVRYKVILATRFQDSKLEITYRDSGDEGGGETLGGGLGSRGGRSEPRLPPRPPPRAGLRAL